MDQLLDQAYIQTGNFSDTEKAPDVPQARSSYRPGGQILINDNRLNQDIGMQGVRVTARRWFTTFQGKTDYNGNFLVNGNFKRPCNYRLHFEAGFFNVREHFFGLINYVDGPKQTGNWYTTINHYSYNNFVGHIFRGAYRYHYRGIDNLIRPIHPSLHTTNYIAINSTANFGSGTNFGIIPIIKIARYRSSNNEFYNDEIFSTACHETAHLTHLILLNANIIAYGSVGGKIRESWAVCVEWWLTGLEYKSRGIANYGDYNYYVSGIQYPNNYAYQYWNQSVDTKYTSLFINCIDKYNEIGKSFAGYIYVGSVNDQVGEANTGYKIANLEKFVIKYAVDLTTASNSLKANKPNSVTNAQIDNLISFY